MTTPRAQIDRIATQLQDLIATHGEGWLTAVRVRVPASSNGPADQWQTKLEERLAECGIDQVDVVVVVADDIEVATLDTTAFDEGWAD